jgi:hypothetical protein
MYIVASNFGPFFVFPGDPEVDVDELVNISSTLSYKKHLRRKRKGNALPLAVS